MRPARGREDSPEAEGYRLRVDQTISERFRGYGALVVYASGLTNGPSDERSVGLLRAAEAPSGSVRSRVLSFEHFGATPDAVETRTLEGLDEATRQRTKMVDGVVDRLSSWKGH